MIIKTYKNRVTLNKTGRDFSVLCFDGTKLIGSYFFSGPFPKSAASKKYRGLVASIVTATPQPELTTLDDVANAISFDL